MSDVYQNLAKHLDSLPAGFPATDTGVELRILNRLFTPEEARAALALTMTAEPAPAIAGRLGRDAEELEALLASMASKGLIFRSDKAGTPYYMAAQFVVGIWEYHLKDLDEGLIRDVNEYLPHLMRKGWVSHKTKQLRVIPVSQKIDAENTIIAYEAAEEIIRRQSKIVVSECICRKEHRMVGQGCDNPGEVCFSFGGGAYFYERNGLGRAVDTRQALDILNLGRQAGLVLQPGNSQNPMGMCMCCGCCCQVLRFLRTLDDPARHVHSNHYATVDENLCAVCEACAGRCHMDAITVAAAAEVDLRRCIGCGACLSACPNEAISLARKPAGDLYVPPKSVHETYMKMALERR